MIGIGLVMFPFGIMAGALLWIAASLAGIRDSAKGIEESLRKMNDRQWREQFEKEEGRRPSA